MTVDPYQDPDVVAMYADARGEGEEHDDPLPDWLIEMHDRFNAAPDRDAKLAVLYDYMSERAALNAIGIMLGERTSDVILHPADDEKEATP